MSTWDTNHYVKFAKEQEQTTIPCHHCDGKGYIQIRDCSGEIQREENCSFCEGTGTKSSSTITTGN